MMDKISLPSEATQLSAASRLFSSAVIKDLASNGRSKLFARLLPQAGVVSFDDPTETVADAFREAFKFLRKQGLRNEYVYRSALTKNVLLGVHSLNTASMLAEFRVGSSKADVVILNGTATAYEIKSERDTLTRLTKQLDDYQKAFAKTYVITSASHLDAVASSIPRSVGILALARWNSITKVREAEDLADAVCNRTIFESLRTVEAKALLELAGKSVPDLPNTKIRKAMLTEFETLRPRTCHMLMVEVLKKSRSLTPMGVIVQRLPDCLKSAALSLRLSQEQNLMLISALETPLRDALNWKQ